MSDTDMKHRILEWAYERALDHGGPSEGIFDLEDAQNDIDADPEAVKRGIAALKLEGLIEIAQSPDVYGLSGDGAKKLDAERKARTERVRRRLLREMIKREKNLKTGNQTYTGPGYFFATNLAKDLDIDRDQAINAMASLESDGFVYPQPGVPTYGGPPSHAYGITSEGREYASRLEPSRAAPAGDTFNIYGSGTTILTGENAVANITQNIGQNQPEIRQLLEKMMEATEEIEDADLREESQTAIEMLGEELTAEEPKPRRITTVARSAWQVFREAVPLVNLAINLYKTIGLGDLLL